MRAIDISQWQGQINWDAVNTEIAIIKMSGGDAGLYYDSQASRNYAEAKRTGKAVGMYHFAGGTDPVGEADFFIRAVSPLEENDVLILDWEVRHSNPVEWCRIFIQTVIDKTGVRPLIYMNTSTENSYDWSPVVNQNIGLWVADYRYSTNDNVPIKHWPTYVMHQFTSSGSEPGIGGRVDVNEWFGTKDQFKLYGWHAPVEPPVVVPPVEPPVPPVVEPPVVIPPVVEPPVVEPPVVVPPVIEKEVVKNFFKKLWAKLLELFWGKG